MAGIEKICEYSGEYPSTLMYKYKNNRIQVMPRYRELFKHRKMIGGKKLNIICIPKHVDMTEVFTKTQFKRFYPDFDFSIIKKRELLGFLESLNEMVEIASNSCKTT